MLTSEESPETPEVVETPEAESSEDLSFIEYDASPEEPPSSEDIVEEVASEATPPVVVTETPTVSGATPDAVQTELAALRAQLAEVTAALQQRDSVKEEEVKPLEIEAVKFVETDDDVRKVFETPEGFNELLNKVMRMGVEKGREFALAEMPAIAQAQAREIVDRRAVITNFYTLNSDLASMAEQVKEEAVALAGKKNYKSYVELLADTEVVVRQKYNKPKPSAPRQAPPAPAKSTNGNRQPAFANSGAGRKPSPGQVSQVEKDLQDLFE